MYNFIKSLLFSLDAETAHQTTFGLLQTFPFLANFSASPIPKKKLSKEVFGINFQNPLGLAAGLDKNAELVDIWEKFGFGFIELGTITPKPQAGNPKKRLFRLKKDSALINRMGFNNDGVEKIALRLEKRKTKIVVGANIGKNKVTPNEKAVNDYLICFERLQNLADYFVVNVSSPNTKDLRSLQEKEPLYQILSSLQDKNSQKKPILLKIAPDLNQNQLDDIIEVVQKSGTAGVIATNTSISRENLKTPQQTITQIGNGGLSGKPIFEMSNEILAYLRKNLDPKIGLIGVGGIDSANSAKKKIKLGADLIQVYTGFIYNGPKLNSNILNSL